jgi:hypothetical protein
LATTDEQDAGQGQDRWQWEQETILLEKGSRGLGFSIAGGIDHPQETEDFGIYVTKIMDSGAASDDGRLKSDF